jgi:hypothetical protein
MRLKLFALFLALQSLSFGIWAFYSFDLGSAPAHAAAATKPTIAVAQTVAPTGLEHLRLSARRGQESLPSVSPATQEEVMEVIKMLPASHVRTLQNLVLDYDPSAHRGLGGKGIIILRAVNMDKQEFAGVLIHEIGHTADLGALQSTTQKEISTFKDGTNPVYADDPSVQFYQITWNSEAEMKRGMTNMDFVSGYAMTDPFEDFAESYVYYVLHNKDFLALGATNESLMQKYLFMKDVVFSGEVFETGDDQVAANRRPWDITIL